MNKFSGFLIASLFFCVAMQPVSAKADCRDIQETADAVHHLANVLERTDVRDLSRKDIKSLEDVIVELQRLANAENNAKLDRAAGKLRNAFEAENKNAFVDAPDDIVDELDRILDNEC